MDRSDDPGPAQWAILGELCDVSADAEREERALGAAEASRIFRSLREMVGDSDAQVLGYRAFLQSRAADGNAKARNVLGLLDPWWSETTAPDAAMASRTGSGGLAGGACR